MSEQQAGHAWAEAFVPDLGWVGFDPANAEPEDHSPTIQALCVTFSGTTSVITANIHTATGINSKRIAVPGHVTANKLAEMLKGVASW